MSDLFWRWVANRLPKRVVYFALIRAWAYATSGKSYERTPVATIAATDVIRRWDLKR